MTLSSAQAHETTDSFWPVVSNLALLAAGLLPLLALTLQGVYARRLLKAQDELFLSHPKNSLGSPRHLRPKDQDSGELEKNKACLQMLSDLAAGLAHEVNNPLAIIIGKVYTIQRGLQTKKFQEPAEESLRKIEAAAQRIGHLVRSLQISAAARSPGQLEFTKVSLIITAALGSFQHLIDQQRIEVRLELEKDLYLECRKDEIVQSLCNLMKNSCEALATAESRWIRIESFAYQGNVLLRISDSGPGIPERIRSKLMQPFQTTKPFGRGMGLGLSTARGIVESHFGYLKYLEQERNTTFEIMLPFNQSAQNLTA